MQVRIMCVCVCVRVCACVCQGQGVGAAVPASTGEVPGAHDRKVGPPPPPRSQRATMRMFCLLQSIFCSSIIFVFFVLYCALSCAARSTVRIPAMQRRKAHSSTALIHPGTQTQEQSFAPPWHPPPADTQTHANAHAKKQKTRHNNNKGRSGVRLDESHDGAGTQGRRVRGPSQRPA